jgi:hypothetical protein
MRARPGAGPWRLTYAGRDLVLDFEPLTGPCGHRHETAAHDPGKHLQHLTAVLHQDCTFGTCRTPQHRSDYEHAIPWPQGRTCSRNGHPCCRRNHRTKQEPGWDVQGTRMVHLDAPLRTQLPQQTHQLPDVAGARQ